MYIIGKIEMKKHTLRKRIHYSVKTTDFRTIDNRMTIDFFHNSHIDINSLCNHARPIYFLK